MRMGAVFTPVFPGLSAQELSDRAHQIKTKVVLTVDGGYRMGKMSAYKEEVVDRALEEYIPRETGLEFSRKALTKAGIAKNVVQQSMEQVSKEIKDDITTHKFVLANILDRILQQKGIED